MTHPANDAPKVELRLLGRFSAIVAGERPRALLLPSRRHRALIAYLAMQLDMGETREQLAALIWGEREDRQARQSLRQSLLTIRKAFEAVGLDPFLSDREHVQLRQDHIAVDAREFLALAGSEAPDDVMRASELYAGEFLSGNEIDSEDYTQWLAHERSRLQAAAAATLKACARLHSQSGAGAEAIRVAERLVALDAGCEEYQRLLIDLLYRYRGRTEALARAESAVRQIATEFGAEPEAETRTLVERIRSGPADQRGGLTQRLPAAGAAKPDAPHSASGPALSSRDAGRRRTFRSALPGLATWQRRSAVWALGGTCVALVVFALVVGKGRHRPTDTRATVERTASVTAGHGDWRSPSVFRGADANPRALADRGISAVVVLPFAGSNENEPASSRTRGITDDLTSYLSRFPGLRVISRSTAGLYAGRPIDVAAIGAELGVHYVVEGTTRIEEGQVRLSVALVDAKTRLRVWSGRFDFGEGDRLSVLDAIAQGIARELHVGVLVDRGRRSPSNDGDPAIGELLAKAWALQLRFMATGPSAEAARLFAEVLKRDPNNHSALVGSAAQGVSALATFTASDRRVTASEAEALLNRAIELEPQNSLAFYFLGLLEKTRGNPDKALAHMARTLELNPSYAPAHANVGHILSRTERLGDALSHVMYAMRLSPKDPNLGLWSLFAGQIAMEMGDDTSAAMWLSKSVALNPKMPFGYAVRAALHALGGDMAAARRDADEVARLAPWLTTDIMVERLVGLSRKGHEPRRLIEGLKRAFDAKR